MLEEPIYLTFFELIHTTGFRNIIAIIWTPIIITIFIYRISKELKERW